jgi:hypothetical protein
MAWAVGLRMLALGNMLLYYTRTRDSGHERTRSEAMQRRTRTLVTLASDNSLCFQLLYVDHLTRCSLFAPP